MPRDRRAAVGSRLTVVQEPTDVYTAWCEHNGLLYVGITNNIDRRIREHRRRPWWSDVDLVLVDTYPDRATAAKVEAGVISHDLPVHNLAGHSCWEQPDCKFTADPLPGTIRLLNRDGGEY